MDRGWGVSDTIVDMPKVTQMLDAGWQVCIEKNSMGSYTVEAHHSNEDLKRRVAAKLEASHNNAPNQTVGYKPDFDWSDDRDWLHTDDFTPEQALTRMAYKCVDGVIL